MDMPKASDADKEHFRSVLPDHPEVVVKSMFGNLVAFVNGNMFAGLFGDQIGVKVLDDDARTELAAIDGVGPFGPDERPMGGYLSLPSAWAREPARMSEWVGRALEGVAALPPKPPKGSKQG